MEELRQLRSNVFATEEISMRSLLSSSMSLDMDTSHDSAGNDELSEQVGGEQLEISKEIFENSDGLSSAPTPIQVPTFSPVTINNLSAQSPAPTKWTPRLSDPLTTHLPTSQPTFSPISTEQNDAKGSGPQVPSPAPTMQQVITNYALNGGEEFQNPDSYQTAALRRLETLDARDVLGDIKLVQFYALYCIFEATNSQSNDFIQSQNIQIPIIPGWDHSYGWEETDLDPCDGWYGISCEDDFVVGIDLYDNMLTGNFPPEITLLASDGKRATGAGKLRHLDLYNNHYLSNGGDSSWISDLGSNFGRISMPSSFFLPFASCSHAFNSLSLSSRLPLFWNHPPASHRLDGG